MQTLTTTMYYDEYEANFGDGFYPLLDKESSHMKPVDISFIEYKLPNGLGEIVWKQTGSASWILGLDGPTGPDLLKFLNEHSSRNHTKIVSGVLNMQLYPKQLRLQSS